MDIVLPESEPANEAMGLFRGACGALIIGVACQLEDLLKKLVETLHLACRGKP